MENELEHTNEPQHDAKVHVTGSGDVPMETPVGYECPVCGNYVSLEESDYGEAILCARCPNGEYTNMEPVYE